MISKIGKYKNSWFTKGILFLTAMSFMSLFGISSYVGSAGKNKPVIKVGNLELLHGDLLAQFNKQMEMIKRTSGENVDENIKNIIMQQLVDKNLSDMVIAKTADKLGVSISDELVRNIVYSRPEFADESGKFDIDRMRKILALYGVTEAGYIKQLKLDVEKQHLVYDPLQYFEVPNIVAEFAYKIKEQRKVFKYIKLETDKTKVDRKISQEEIEQYYKDFSDSFMQPEARDVDFVVFSNADIVNQIVPTDEEVNSYYKERISQFETPEQRRVLQMVLGSEEEAVAAKKELDAGKDFFAVALEKNKQSKEDTDFGVISKDMMVEEIANAAFSTPLNKVTGPIQSDLGWHILKITEIHPMTKVDFAKAKALIVAELRKEKTYEAFQAMAKEIDDKIGGGADLKSLAKDLKTKVYSVGDLTVEGSFKKSSDEYKTVITNRDFLDMAFSYNPGEISQIMETNDGLVILSVKKITDTHPKRLEDVKSEIEKMWADNEKSAIVQEAVNNVMNDLDSGDKIESVAPRFNLSVKTTSAIKRDETFEGLSPNAMAQLFQEAYGTPKLLDLGNIKLVIVPENARVQYERPSQKAIDAMKPTLKLNEMREYSGYLIDSYSKDFDVRVKYRLIGLGE